MLPSVGQRILTYALPKRRHTVVYQNNPFCPLYYTITTRLLSSHRSERWGGVRQSVTFVEGPSGSWASFRWDWKQSDDVRMAKSSGLRLLSYWVMLKRASSEKKILW